MANLKTVLVVTHGNESSAQIKSMLQKPASKPKEECLRLEKFFEGAAGGERQCKFDVLSAPVQASGTITLSSLVAADTVTVGTQVFTSSASPTGNNQFLSTGGDTAVAAALAAKINAHPSLAYVVTASASGAVVTVTAVVPGLIGNMIALAISAHGSVSAATLASGSNGTQVTYRAGV